MTKKVTVASVPKKSMYFLLPFFMKNIWFYIKIDDKLEK